VAAAKRLLLPPLFASPCCRRTRFAGRSIAALEQSPDKQRHFILQVGHIAARARMGGKTKKNPGGVYISRRGLQLNQWARSPAASAGRAGGDALSSASAAVSGESERLPQSALATWTSTHDRRVRQGPGPYALSACAL